MNDLNQFRIGTTARRGGGRAQPHNRFGAAINRYLGASGYPDPYAVVMARPEAGRRPSPLAATGGTVLVGVDDSAISCVALDHAAIEADLHGWGIRLVTVRRTGAGDAGAELLERLTDRVHASAPQVVVSSRLATGAHPAQILLAQAADADLVVVGHRHGATVSAIGRSVADRVGRAHPGPVLVVRMPGWPAGPEFGSRPLVAAVDGSTPSQAAVDFALAEARVRGCDVTLLHIVGDRMDLARRLESRDGVPVRHRILSGDPVNALIEESKRAAAVVVGRHRHSMISGSLLGPAAHVLPVRAFCPVFLAG
ncbi:universal stress protein [Actinoplanes sp. NPDC023714]|uniref:universal stress protein n=1 Tax=Actinoplanes sp. NPDC023714 TaxID=3154322 RepID=UPI0033F2FC7E